MFIDDEKMVRDGRRRESRAIVYITVTALAACVLMIVGLMKVASAATFDDERSILHGKFGETSLALDLPPAGPALGTDTDLLAVDGIDRMATASTKAQGDKETSIDRRLATALGLSGLITLAGLSQIAGRSLNRGPSPNVPWHSEA
ncbi:hypothetical protein SAMN05892877_11864 [Rhizobium subbaraonis]|uniref:Uncharacterized protein n=1 Tax=Rhizobium subbaraonis TaxID=908946 RepID=A0A285UV96_9HYPH|nr:hypothetical protein [Rhizobium subbaraonis]SOC45835.1 hypothetical protein SAMN05892877_11864 [Rhizobium subbaraonis]